ncbi:MAG: hypothetical protein ACREMZ_05585 [Gemmatimonadales bacterium]
MRQLLLLLLVLGSFACRRDKPETGTAASASPYTSDSDTSAREGGFEGTVSGTELQAPRLIPAMRNQLELMRTGSQVDEDNLLAYKNLATDLISSMAADLQRVGYPDTGHFRALSDSVLEDIGGGAGTPTDLEQSELPQHVERMSRLLDMYQGTMRDQADKL